MKEPGRRKSTRRGRRLEGQGGRGWGWKTGWKDGKVAGKEEKQAGAWNSTWEDGKAAGGMGKQRRGQGRAVSGREQKSKRKDGKGAGKTEKQAEGHGRAPGTRENAAGSWRWGGKSRRQDGKGAGKADKHPGDLRMENRGHSPALACSR